MDILLGLIKPQEGKILIDNKDIHEDIKSWQKNISYVAQKTFIFDDTIKNNIIFGKKYDQIKFDNVIKMSCLENLIKNLEGREDTKLGDKGAKLSGGEIQRIGIARALYNNTEFLIFDEATSSLDKNRI